MQLPQLGVQLQAPPCRCLPTVKISPADAKSFAAFMPCSLLSHPHSRLSHAAFRGENSSATSHTLAHKDKADASVGSTFFGPPCTELHPYSGMLQAGRLVRDCMQVSNTIIEGLKRQAEVLIPPVVALVRLTQTESRHHSCH